MKKSILSMFHQSMLKFSIIDDNLNLKRLRIQMKQQHFKQQGRGKDEKPQEFHFVQFPHKHDTQSRKNSRGNHRRQGFTMWSDYVALDTDSVEIPIETEGSISISLGNPDNSSSMDQDDSNNISQRLTQPAKPEKPPMTIVKEENREKISSANKQTNSMPLPGKTNQRSSSNQSPFAMPSNISEVKPKEGSHFVPGMAPYTPGSNRNSEQLFLDLFKTQEKQDELKEEKNNAKVPQKPTQKQQQQKQQPKEDKNARKSDKLQKPSNKPVENKDVVNNDRVSIGVKPPRPSVPPKRQTQTFQQNTKGKRVTIIERGKIKLPTDSISMEFDYILPSEIRDAETESTLKRRLVIEEEEDGGDRVIPKKVQQPMDIVDPKEEAENIAKIRQKQVLKEAEEKLKDIAKNAPKPKIHKDNKIQKIIRIGDNNKSIKQNQKSQDSKRPSISNSRFLTTKNDSILNKRPSEDSKPKSKSKSKSEPKHKLKSHNPSVNGQKKGKKAIRQQKSGKQITKYIQHDQQASSSIANHRPKRNRTNKCQFWRNEKPVYNTAGVMIGISNVSSADFMEILGFHNPDKIQVISHALFNSQGLHAEIILPARKKLYSSGIFLKKMIEHKMNTQFFNMVSLRAILQEKSKDFQKIKIYIDDVREMDAKDLVQIQKGQTFSIENESSGRAFRIQLRFFNKEQELENSEQKKEKKA